MTTLFLIVSGFVTLYWINVEVKKKANKEITQYLLKQKVRWEEFPLIQTAISREIDMYLKQTHMGWHLNSPPTQNLLTKDFVAMANITYLNNHLMEQNFVNISHRPSVVKYLTLKCIAYDQERSRK